MAGGGGHAPPPPADNGGEFLLSLLQRPNHRPQTPQQPQLPPQFQLSPQLTPFTSPPPPQQPQNSHLHNLLPPHQSYLTLDPAVAAVGPSVALFQSNGRDLLSHTPWPHNHSTSPLPPGFLPWSSPVPQFQGSQTLGFPNHDHFQQKQQLEHKLQFGSIPSNIQIPESLLAGNSNLNTTKEREAGLGSGNFNVFERNSQFNPKVNPSLRNFDMRDRDRKGGGGGNHRAPPGFSNKSRGGGNRDYGSRRRELDHNVGKAMGNHTELTILSGQDGRSKNGNDSAEMGLTGQLDRPSAPAGSNLHSVSAVDVEEALSDVVDNGKDDGHELDELGGELADSLLLEGDGCKRLEEGSNSKRDKKQSHHPRKESRSDNRGKYILSQRMRMMKRQMECRRDIDRLNFPFLAIYESLIPPEEEKAKQKQLLTLLEKLVQKEWPEARLYLYGSCANSFDILKSDIDVCLAIEDVDFNKSEVLLKLADILQSDNLQNVQALTRARVPIVKLMDPVTGISCDICINNVLAVVNTKLLHDYAQIDERLRQLAFIVKHWAKSRGVNETYQGTLSSYAYVLMCIHFLQLRRPAILPCLQEMETTYSVTIDDIECSYFDQVEKLSGFGSRNKETIGHLVWAFFNYWAYRHDYPNDVISVRSGSIISKQEKDWTRRVENDRHLICIEDPFLITHDLGRVVDKYSIRVLREEFERAANIMQYDPNPCVTLFEPYIPT